MSAHNFNNLFNQLQSNIKDGKPAHVLHTFGIAAVMVIKDQDLIFGELSHLLLGAHPSLYTRDKGYRTFDEKHKPPAQYLRNFSDMEGNNLYLMALNFLEMAEGEVNRRIKWEVEQDSLKREMEEFKLMLSEGYSETAGTPFDKNWQIRSPEKESK